MYSEMKIIALEEHIDYISVINQKNIELIDRVSEKLEYAITYELDTDVADVFKMYGVRLLDIDDNLASRIIDYIKLIHRIMKIDTFIFVNLKQFINSDEIVGIYESAIYEKINMVIIQAAYYDKMDAEYNIIVA